MISYIPGAGHLVSLRAARRLELLCTYLGTSVVHPTSILLGSSRLSK